MASWAVNFYVRRHLQAYILTPATAAKRTAVSCRVRIRNGAFLPVMRYGCQVSVRNDLTEEDQTVTLTGSIGAKGESSQTILLQNSFCGRVYMQISRFTLLDYLGLLPMKALVKADARLTILPDLYPMEADMTARPAYADDGTSNRRGEDRSEVYQLREYRPGDDIRQIHWKLSSKLDELILKEASQPESRSLLVFWDKRPGGNPQQMDALAEVVSSAGMALLQSGVPYTLCWTDRDDRSAIFFTAKGAAFNSEAISACEALPSRSSLTRPRRRNWNETRPHSASTVLPCLRSSPKSSKVCPSFFSAMAFSSAKRETSGNAAKVCSISSLVQILRSPA